jgi:L-ascorbate metabolism protein UlaG (beta-lactamase superfamily)
MINSTQPQLQVIHLGGPTIILEIGGLRIITDPTLDPKGTAFKISDKMTETKLAGPALEDLGNIDLVLLSHDQHPDNLDKLGRELLFKVDNTITTKAGAERLRNNTTGLEPWNYFEIEAPDGSQIMITATPARHGPAGSEHITGDVIGFLLQVNGIKKYEIYLTGDTVFYDGIVEVANRFNPQYVFIFAGAAKPRGPFNVTMGSNDAIDTAFAFPNARIIPLHYEGWSHYTENAEVLTAAFSVLGIAERLMILDGGKLTSLPV